MLQEAGTGHRLGGGASWGAEPQGPGLGPSEDELWGPQVFLLSSSS